MKMLYRRMSRRFAEEAFIYAAAQAVLITFSCSDIMSFVFSSLLLLSFLPQHGEDEQDISVDIQARIGVMRCHRGHASAKSVTRSQARAVMQKVIATVRMRHVASS